MEKKREIRRKDDRREKKKKKRIHVQRKKVNELSGNKKWRK